MGLGSTEPKQTNPQIGRDGQAGTTPKEQVLQELRTRLRRDGYRSGDKLPPERQLADQLGVSRGVLRSSLAVLEAEGKIWRGVGQGTFVGSRAVERPDDFGNISRLTSPHEIMEVRLALEPKLARLAAQRATSLDLDEMKRCLEKSAAAERYRTYELWDGRFHRAIAEAAHNRLFLALFDAMNSVRDHTVWGRAREATVTPARQRQSSEQHRGIARALEGRDAVGADRYMRQHLEAVRAVLLDGAPNGSDP